MTATLNNTTATIEVGTHVHSILYGGRDGIVYGVHGTAAPETVRDLGGVSVGGRATYDVVFETHLSKGLPESVVRGVQWRIYDEPLATGDEIVEAISAANAAVAAKAEEGRKNAERRAAERATHAADNPHLVKAADKPDWSPSRVAAENIRRELKRTFPKTKFAVSKDGYDCVRVKWTDGPTTEMVEAVTRKYNGYKADDWNDDISVSNPDATFATVFGDPKYVFTTRDDSIEGMRFAWVAADRGTADEVPEKWWDHPRRDEFRRTWSATDLTGRV